MREPKNFPPVSERTKYDGGILSEGDRLFDLSLAGASDGGFMVRSRMESYYANVCGRDLWRRIMAAQPRRRSFPTLLLLQLSDAHPAARADFFRSQKGAAPAERRS